MSTHVLNQRKRTSTTGVWRTGYTTATPKGVERIEKIVIRYNTQTLWIATIIRRLVASIEDLMKLARENKL